MSRLQLFAVGRDEGAHPLGGTVDVGDVVRPQDGTGVAREAGGEDLVIPRGTLITEDAHHTNAAQTLTRQWVAGGAVGTLHVTIAGYADVIRREGTSVNHYYFTLKHYCLSLRC